jgi:urease accessory protein
MELAAIGTGASGRGAGTPLPLPRARGTVTVEAVRRGGRSVLADLGQAGSAKALFPRGEGPMLDAVLINTAGGIAGGDVFSYAGRAGAGAWLGMTTQAAERAYRARPGEVGEISVRLGAEPGGRIDWLPQETILFDGSALRRRLEVDLAGDARLLAVEAVVLGRAAMGERLTGFGFVDEWRVRRDGRLVHAEALRLAGPTGGLGRPARLGGARAVASVLLAGAEAADLVAPLRRLLVGEAGASLVRPGVLAVRMLAPDGYDLRRRLLPVLELLRGAALPGMWKM